MCIAYQHHDMVLDVDSVQLTLQVRRLLASCGDKGSSTILHVTLHATKGPGAIEVHS